MVLDVILFKNKCHFQRIRIIIKLLCDDPVCDVNKKYFTQVLALIALIFSPKDNFASI